MHGAFSRTERWEKAAACPDLKVAGGQQYQMNSNVGEAAVTSLYAGGVHAPSHQRMAQPFTAIQIYMQEITSLLECDLIHNDPFYTWCYIIAPQLHIIESTAKLSQIVWFTGALVAKLSAITSNANTLQLCLYHNVIYDAISQYHLYAECGKTGNVPVSADKPNIPKSG